MIATKEETRAGHRVNKVSTVNLKRLWPLANTRRVSVLEYRALDELEGGKASVTWWEGDSPDGNWEERLTLTFKQTRQKKFNIVGVPFAFMLVNGEIYYRMIGE